MTPAHQHLCSVYMGGCVCVVTIPYMLSAYQTNWYATYTHTNQISNFVLFCSTRKFVNMECVFLAFTMGGVHIIFVFSVYLICVDIGIVHHKDRSPIRICTITLLWSPKVYIHRVFCMVMTFLCRRSVMFRQTR